MQYTAHCHRTHDSQEVIWTCIFFKEHLPVLEPCVTTSLNSLSCQQTLTNHYNGVWNKHKIHPLQQSLCHKTCMRKLNAQYILPEVFPHTYNLHSPLLSFCLFIQPCTAPLWITSCKVRWLSLSFSYILTSSIQKQMHIFFPLIT